MSDSPPTIQVREWTKTSPAPSGPGAILRGLRLDDGDRALLSRLEHTTFRVHELRDGLMIETGPHVGTVTLSSVRIVVMPKIRLRLLMRMVAYAFDLSDITLAVPESRFEAGRNGLVDLLGLSLLHQARRIARGGLQARYVETVEDLGTVRGRVDLRHRSTHPKSTTLRCGYEDLTADHVLNQTLAAGLRLASKVMESRDLRLDIARAADQIFGDLRLTDLDEQTLRDAAGSLDRRSRRYQTAIGLVALIYHCSHLAEHRTAGGLRLSSFLLDMNLVFERFLERYLREHSPPGVEVATQESRSDVFSYLENPGGWQRPTIRPDLVFRRRGEVVAVGDAKYKNRYEHPPTTSELYQLTTYGLSYDMAEPRDVLLLHPTVRGASEMPARLMFAPQGSNAQVRVRLVGVPVDEILAGRDGWRPLEQAG